MPVTANQPAATTRALKPPWPSPCPGNPGRPLRVTYRLAGATFTKSTMRAGFVLARVINDPRLKVESYGGRQVHSLELADAAQVNDADVRRLLAEAYWLGD